MSTAPSRPPAVIIATFPAGWLRRRPDGRFIWRARTYARMEGFAGQRELGTDEAEARRLAAEEDARIAAHVKQHGRIRCAASVASPDHPADHGCAVASEGPDGSWSIRRGGEVVAAGLRRFEALDALRNGGGLVAELSR